MRAQEVYLIFFVSCNIVLCAVSKIHPFYIYMLSALQMGLQNIYPTANIYPVFFFLSWILSVALKPL